MKISTGLEKLVNGCPELVKGRKIGLVAHPASITSKYQHALEVLAEIGAKVCILFGPEHGFDGMAQDMEAVNSDSDELKIPIRSIYGESFESLTPRIEDLKELDALVVDLFDVGTRYYTFCATAILCLRACHKAGIQMILLDRPNPLGGKTVEGPCQKDNFLSFVGLKKMAVRHGLTIGEICNWAAHEEGLEGLTVVKMTGWKREMEFEDTGLPWIMPSPNMPNLETAYVYPGLCLLEGTQTSEGRGTTTPFLIFGQPEMASLTICNSLNNMTLKGVFFRPVSFKPMFQKHAGYVCNGAFIHIVDRKTFLPFRVGVAILSAIHNCFPEIFQWRRESYEFIDDILAIDLLTGSSKIREAIEDKIDFLEIISMFNREEQEYIELKKQFHLYH